MDSILFLPLIYLHHVGYDLARSNEASATADGAREHWNNILSVPSGMANDSPSRTKNWTEDTSSVSMLVEPLPPEPSPPEVQPSLPFSSPALVRHQYEILHAHVSLSRSENSMTPDGETRFLNREAHASRAAADCHKREQTQEAS